MAIELQEFKLTIGDRHPINFKMEVDKIGNQPFFYKISFADARILSLFIASFLKDHSIKLENLTECSIELKKGL